MRTTKPKYQTSDVLCPICWSVKNEPCYNLIHTRPNKQGALRRGKPIPVIHNARKTKEEAANA